MIKKVIEQYRVAGAELARIAEQLEKLSTERQTLGIAEPSREEERLRRVLIDRREHLLSVQRYAEMALSAECEPGAALVLKCRYIDGLTAEEAGEKLHYCTRQIRRICKKAFVQNPRNGQGRSLQASA